MSIKIRVIVEGAFVSTVKHIAGGVDKEVIEVGPDSEHDFGFHEFVGENVFVVGPERPVVVDEEQPAHIVEQEQQKEVATGKESVKNATEDKAKAESAAKQKKAAEENKAKAASKTSATSTHSSSTTKK